MMKVTISRFIAIISILFLSILSQAQPLPAGVREIKPYKILTSGKQVTIKSTKNIESIMVWTASGHRIVEQREVNAASYSFNVNISEKVFFIMIGYPGMKPYTEKIGVQ
jgi:hypothetical protein